MMFFTLHQANSFSGNPSEPKNLVVTAHYFGTTENPFHPFLTWDSVQGYNIQYKIYRALSTGGTPNFIHIGNSNIPSFMDNMILYTFIGGSGICEYQFKTFLYRVTAIDSAKNESDPSNLDSISGYLDPCAPEDKSNLNQNQFELKKLINYPNPFNPETTINYSIPNGEYVSVKIYNTLGEEIATLFSGYVEAGKHSVSFDASKLSSGMYIYKLSAGSKTQIKKMILAK